MSVHLDDKFMQVVLPLCPRLKVFRTSFALIPQNTLSLLSQHCTLLKELELSVLDNQYPIAPVLESCAKLETLILDQYVLSSDDEVALLLNCRNLKEFRYESYELDGVPLNPYLVTALCGNCPRLERLDINDHSIVPVQSHAVDTLLLMIAKQLPRIRALSLCWGVPATRGLTAVLHNCMSLEFLKIPNWQGVTSAALLHMLTQCHALRSADLRKNDIASGEAANVDSSGSGTNSLRLLSFCKFTALTDAGMDNILAPCVKLCNLVVEQSPLVTVAVLDSILRRCPQMKKVYFTQCGQITQELVDAKLRDLGSPAVDVVVFAKKAGFCVFSYDD